MSFDCPAGCKRGVASSSCSASRSLSRVIDSHAIEERPTASGVGVRERCDALPPDNVRGHREKGLREGDIGGPLKKIVVVRDAEPRHIHTRSAARWRKQLQYRGG